MDYNTARYFSIAGLTIFVAFTFAYVVALIPMGNEIDDMRMESEVEELRIDNLSDGNTKNDLIREIIIKERTIAERTWSLNLYRIILGIFILAGFATMIYGGRAMHNEGAGGQSSD